MTELAKYKTNIINNLTTTYKNNSAVTKNKYNILINNVLNNKTTTRKIKSQQINILVNQGNSVLAQLLSVLNDNISKVNKFTPPIIQINKNRKALLIGINYTGSNFQLEGCINDIENMTTKLSSAYSFSSITKMTDTTTVKPTKDNILNGLKSLLVNSQKGDLLYFHYSGHGGYVKDTNGDELDGNDELIYPIDMVTITDDELKQIIMSYLKEDVTLFAFFDSCFSGSVLDLKYQYLDSLNYNDYTENNKNLETLGHVFMISGCTDLQTSADSVFNNKANGAMTWSLLEALKQKPKCSWRELLKSMRDLLKNSQYEQIPQFSSGIFENIDATVFI